MIALAQSIVAYSYNVFAIANGNGTPFALLSKAQQVTWQTSFGSAPVAVNIIIETSLDNVSWSTVATTTATAGATGTFVTSAIFIRASIVSHTGGDTVTVGIVAKVGILGIATPTSVMSGSLVEFDGTTGSKFKELVFSGDDTEFLNGDGTFSTPAGGGGSPGGLDTQVQFNDSGSFGGDAGFTYDKITGILTIEIIEVPTGNTLNLASSDNGGITVVTDANPNNQQISLHAGGAIFQIGASGFRSFTSGNTANIDAGLGAITGESIQTNAYKSSDGSSGITQDVTTGTLVGKTMSFKNGLLVDFA